MESKKPLLLLVDGSALVHRAFHALPPLTAPKTGETVGAVYGFSMMLIKAINDLKPTHYAIAFDRKAPTFRHQMFDQYKAHRPAMPDELANQFGRVRDVIASFRIPLFELDGYEADDILGALAQQSSSQDMDTVILTGDADIMQLVSPRVKVYYPRPGGSFSDAVLYDEDAVRQRYGVPPSQIADLKALKGDPSDNIPGVPGVGEKTALKLMQQFGSVEDMLDNIDRIEPAKLRDKIKENVEAVKQSKELTTIVRETPVKLDLDECCQLGRYDRARVADIFRELGFNSLLSKLPESGAEAPVSPPHHAMETRFIETRYQAVNTTEAQSILVRRLSAAKTLAISTAGSSISPMSAHIAGISLSQAAGEAYYIPIAPHGAGTDGQLPLEIVKDYLKPLLENGSISKYFHNGKFDLILLAENGINLDNLAFDTMLAAYLLGEKALGLKEIVFSRLGLEITPASALVGAGSKQIPLFQVDIEQVTNFACANADMIGRLTDFLTGELLAQRDLGELFSKVELPLVPVLAELERCGVILDTELLREMSGRLGDLLANEEKTIHEMAGEEFNINSPLQLGIVLFEKLNLPGRKVRGRYSTEASVLEELRGYPIIQHILDYRQLMKLKSTYIDALPGLINPRTGRVHTSFNQTRTTTGRLSSSEPNLQNIPVRGEMGREIRKAFIAPPGSVLIAGDYSQIDLRVLAHLSQDENLLEAFQQDKDIHAATAAQLFGVNIAEVKPDMRRLAKTVNFGVIYGMSEFGLEQATELSRRDAGKFISAYFEKYPGVASYLENTREQARLTGFVQTVLGHRRYIPEVNSPNRVIREAAERMAINMPVQGTSSDIIKVAMINLHCEIHKRKLKSRMLLQVHDELIFEVPQDEIELMTRLIRDRMSNAVSLSIPVKVDIKSGINWGAME
ncbi:MAG: DNA polymerase I [Dehalococcoidales bacterium]|nr:DNA polymerase I [Dehalococcoidales bacterium]